MANKKYKLSEDYWATDGVYDLGQSKTQRQINSDLNGALSAITPLDTVPTNGSAKGITSDAVYDAFNTVSSGTITKLVETGTLDTISCTRNGKIVCVSGRIYSMTNNDGALRNYFQIPEGFRPSTAMRVMGYIRIESSTDPTDQGKTPYSAPVIVGIQPNGVVNFGWGGGVQVSQVGFAGSYIV